MKDIRNTTHRPLRVPLPKGSVLHLGPLRTGQIAPNAVDHPPLVKLIEAGDLEILGDGAKESSHPIKEGSDHAETHGHGQSSAFHPSGDR